MKLPFLRPKPELDPLEQALDLRQRYGDEAEQWCEIGILASDELTQRRTLYRVREALRSLPHEEALV